MDYKLICTNCRKSFNAETSTGRCTECNEPLEFEEVKDGIIDAEYSMEKGIFKRYKSFFPFLELNETVSLGEGMTPLVHMDPNKSGIAGTNIHIKNEGVNPTWSFKDRGTLTGVLYAKHMGYARVGTVSTGNMAASVAAYAAKANMEAIILVKAEMSEEKIGPIGIYGPRLIRVKGNYRKLYSESIRLGHKNGIYFINSDAPYRVEGYKTTAFEIFEQLGGKVPHYVIVPTSAGGNFRGIEKGFRELMSSGITDRMPFFVASQARGCNPVARAYKSGLKTIEPLEDYGTIAHAIENPFPPSGNQVLRLVSGNKGMVVDITDEDIISHQKILAASGIFVQPASATSLAAANKLINEGVISETADIVCIATASGLKFTESLKYHNMKVESCDIENLDNVMK
ncbi:MAG: threonine synthase [Bacillota bacterium]